MLYPRPLKTVEGRQAGNDRDGEELQCMKGVVEKNLTETKRQDVSGDFQRSQ